MDGQDANYIPVYEESCASTLTDPADYDLISFPHDGTDNESHQDSSVSIPLFPQDSVKPLVLADLFDEESNMSKSATASVHIDHDAEDPYASDYIPPPLLGSVKRGEGLEVIKENECSDVHRYTESRRLLSSSNDKRDNNDASLSVKLMKSEDNEEEILFDWSDPENFEIVQTNSNRKRKRRSRAMSVCFIVTVIGVSFFILMLLAKRGQSSKNASIAQGDTVNGMHANKGGGANADVDPITGDTVVGSAGSGRYPTQSQNENFTQAPEVSYGRGSASKAKGSASGSSTGSGSSTTGSSPTAAPTEFDLVKNITQQYIRDRVHGNSSNATSSSTIPFGQYSDAVSANRSDNSSASYLASFAYTNSSAYAADSSTVSSNGVQAGSQNASGVYSNIYSDTNYTPAADGFNIKFSSKSSSSLKAALAAFSSPTYAPAVSPDSSSSQSSQSQSVYSKDLVSGTTSDNASYKASVSQTNLFPTSASASSYNDTTLSQPVLLSEEYPDSTYRQKSPQDGSSILTDDEISSSASSSPSAEGSALSDSQATTSGSYGSGTDAMSDYAPLYSQISGSGPGEDISSTSQSLIESDVNGEEGPTLGGEDERMPSSHQHYSMPSGADTDTSSGSQHGNGSTDLTYAGGDTSMSYPQTTYGLASPSGESYSAPTDLGQQDTLSQNTDSSSSSGLGSSMQAGGSEYGHSSEGYTTESGTAGSGMDLPGSLMYKDSIGSSLHSDPSASYPEPQVSSSSSGTVDSGEWMPPRPNLGLPPSGQALSGEHGDTPGGHSGYPYSSETASQSDETSKGVLANNLPLKYLFMPNDVDSFGDYMEFAAANEIDQFSSSYADENATLVPSDAPSDLQSDPPTMLTTSLGTQSVPPGYTRSGNAGSGMNDEISYSTTGSVYSILSPAVQPLLIPATVMQPLTWQETGYPATYPPTATPTVYIESVNGAQALPDYSSSSGTSIPAYSAAGQTFPPTTTGSYLSDKKATGAVKKTKGASVGAPKSDGTSTAKKSDTGYGAKKSSTVSPSANYDAGIAGTVSSDGDITQLPSLYPTRSMPKGKKSDASLTPVLKTISATNSSSTSTIASSASIAVHDSSPSQMTYQIDLGAHAVLTLPYPNVPSEIPVVPSENTTATNTTQLNSTQGGEYNVTTEYNTSNVSTTLSPFFDNESNAPTEASSPSVTFGPVITLSPVELPFIVTAPPTLSPTAVPTMTSSDVPSISPVVSPSVPPTMIFVAAPSIMPSSSTTTPSVVSPTLPPVTSATPSSVIQTIVPSYNSGTVVTSGAPTVSTTSPTIVQTSPSISPSTSSSTTTSKMPTTSPSGSILNLLTTNGASDLTANNSVEQIDTDNRIPSSPPTPASVSQGVSLPLTPTTSSVSYPPTITNEAMPITSSPIVSVMNTMSFSTPSPTLSQPELSEEATVVTASTPSESLPSETDSQQVPLTPSSDSLFSSPFMPSLLSKNTSWIENMPERSSFVQSFSPSDNATSSQAGTDGQSAHLPQPSTPSSTASSSTLPSAAKEAVKSEAGMVAVSASGGEHGVEHGGGGAATGPSSVGSFVADPSDTTTMTPTTPSASTVTVTTTAPTSSPKTTTPAPSKAATLAHITHSPTSPPATLPLTFMPTFNIHEQVDRVTLSPTAATILDYLPTIMPTEDLSEPADKGAGDGAEKKGKR
jgi:flocculation protein FLO11